MWRTGSYVQESNRHFLHLSFCIFKAQKSFVKFRSCFVVWGNEKQTKRGCNASQLGWITAVVTLGTSVRGSAWPVNKKSQVYSIKTVRVHTMCKCLWSYNNCQSRKINCHVCQTEVSRTIVSGTIKLSIIQKFILLWYRTTLDVLT